MDPVLVSRTRFDVPWFYENAKPCLRRVRYAYSNKSSNYVSGRKLGIYVWCRTLSGASALAFLVLHKKILSLKNTYHTVLH